MSQEPTQHVSTITDDGDGWYDVTCSCGFSFPGAPGAETAADIWGDHKVEAHTADLRAQLEAAEAVIRRLYNGWYVIGDIQGDWWANPDQDNPNDKVTPAEADAIARARGDQP